MAAILIFYDRLARVFARLAATFRGFFLLFHPVLLAYDGVFFLDFWSIMLTLVAGRLFVMKPTLENN